MVSEVLADARHILHHGNAQAPELCGWPHAREHEELGRSDSPGTQDDVRTGDGIRLLATVHGDPHRPVALKQNAVPQTVGSNGEVQAVPTRVQVAESSTEADAIVIIRDRWTYARSAGAIVVRAFRKASGPAGGVEGPLGRMACC